MFNIQTGDSHLRESTVFWVCVREPPQQSLKIQLQILFLETFLTLQSFLSLQSPGLCAALQLFFSSCKSKKLAYVSSQSMLVHYRPGIVLVSFKSSIFGTILEAANLFSSYIGGPWAKCDMCGKRRKLQTRNLQTTASLLFPPQQLHSLEQCFIIGLNFSHM